MKDFKELIRMKGFSYLLVGKILSQITVNVLNFLILTRIYIITGSTIATSLLWVSYILPTIFFGPIGAASTDLLSCKKVLMVTNLLQSMTVLVFALTQNTSVFLPYVIVLVYSFFNQFNDPAESSALPALVSKKYLPHANSLFFMIQQASLIVGFGFAGILHGVLGFSGSLILCSVFLFIAFASTIFLPEMKPFIKVPGSIDEALVAFFKTVYEGYEFIKKNKSILFPLLLLIGMQVSLAVLTVNLPLVATEILRVSINYVGLLVVVPVGVGAMLGTIAISKNLTRKWRKKLVIETSFLMLIIALFIIVFVVPLLPNLLKMIFEPISVMLVGAGFVGVTIPTLTYLQEVTPKWLRGRVFGNLWFLTSIATLFPVIFSGAITQYFGIKSLLVVLLFGVVLVYGYSRRHGQSFIEKQMQNGN